MFELDVSLALVLILRILNSVMQLFIDHVVDRIVRYGNICRWEWFYETGNI